jgi:hypothetical protein
VKITLKPGSVPSVFPWKADSNTRRPIVKHSIPEKKSKQDLSDEAESSETHEEMDSVSMSDDG